MRDALPPPPQPSPPPPSTAARPAGPCAVQETARCGARARVDLVRAQGTSFRCPGHLVHMYKLQVAVPCYNLQLRSRASASDVARAKFRCAGTMTCPPSLASRAAAAVTGAGIARPRGAQARPGHCRHGTCEACHARPAGAAPRARARRAGIYTAVADSHK